MTCTMWQNDEIAEKSDAKVKVILISILVLIYECIVHLRVHMYLSNVKRNGFPTLSLADEPTSVFSFTLVFALDNMLLSIFAK